MIRLRPHHGMCLAYFEGKGYSDGFTGNMQHMLELLEKGADVEMAVFGDEICKACPNLKHGVCLLDSELRETQTTNYFSVL